MTATRKETLAEGVTIYALHRAGSDRVRYVGKTSGPPLRRLVYHLHGARRGNKRPLCHWLRRCLADGQRPHVTVLEVVPSGEDWAARERFWIRHYRGIGTRLFNVTDGGEGLSGHSPTWEHRERIANKLRKGSWFNCEQCPEKFWRKPAEVKAGDRRFCSRDCYQTSLRGISKAVSRLCTERGNASAAAARLERTHCKRGHPLSGDNLFRTSHGSRGCRACHRLHKRKYREKSR